jgi:hypothetical protein
MDPSGNDQDRQTAHRRREPRWTVALATAQDMVNSAEQFLLLYAMASAPESNTTLAAVKTARAVLFLAQAVLRSVQKNQH